MKKWKEVCARQAARLRSALELYKHANALAEHGEVRNWLDDAKLRKLEDTKNTIQDKLVRLDSAEFHIAVVGAEKTGKSSFINAWLGNDLLPSQSGRCTYTTTRLHSAMSEDEQKLVVRPKSHAEFEELIADLERLAKSSSGNQAENARRDLEIINRNKSSMLELLGGEPIKIPFQTLDEINADLKKYVANPAYAYAIKDVDLYTKSLASIDGILFYDVPGIDSGLEKHVRDTREMLKASDAVIMVKRLEEPDIKGHEQTILGYVETGDDSVAIKDKLFIFMSKIDCEHTAEGFRRNKGLALESCAPYRVDESKIVFGAATAALLLSGQLKDRAYIRPVNELKSHMRELLDLPDEEDATIMAATGIDKLKNRMDAYLINEREAILAASCDKLIGSIEDISTYIQKVVREHVPDDPDEVRDRHNVDIKTMFNDWFSKQWDEVMASFSPETDKKLIQDSMSQMQISYMDNARAAIARLKLYDPEKRDTFFSARSTEYGGEDYERMNGAIRDEINEEVIVELQNLSASISSDLHDRLMEYMDSISARFNNCVDIRAMLLREMDALPDEYYRKQLNSALSALYLRYARPLARCLMQYRRGSRERMRIARENRITCDTLSQSYSQDQPDEFGRLMDYLTDRREPRGVREPQRKSRVVFDQTETKYTDSQANDSPDDKPGRGSRPVYDSRDDVIAELEKDREALQAYLGGSVFACSGIMDYADSELERIRRIFIGNKSRVYGLLANAYEKRLPAIMKLLPPQLHDTECDTRIADMLRQLAISLQNRAAI